jgi:hypothetical protein
VPLVVELSGDGQSWTEVARRRELFYEWTAWFSARQARYVRLRADHPSALHLGSVQIR